MNREECTSILINKRSVAVQVDVAQRQSDSFIRELAARGFESHHLSKVLFKRRLKANDVSKRIFDLHDGPFCFFDIQRPSVKFTAKLFHLR